MPFNKIQLNSEYSIFPLELKRKQKLYITHIYLPTGCRSKENVCQHTQNLLLAFASKKNQETGMREYFLLSSFYIIFFFITCIYHFSHFGEKWFKKGNFSGDFVVQSLYFMEEKTETRGQLSGMIKFTQLTEDFNLYILPHIQNSIVTKITTTISIIIIHNLQSLIGMLRVLIIPKGASYNSIKQDSWGNLGHVR